MKTEIILKVLVKFSKINLIAIRLFFLDFIHAYGGKWSHITSHQPRVTLLSPRGVCVIKTKINKLLLDWCYNPAGFDFRPPTIVKRSVF
jgi:hypothetical protein